MMHAVYFKSQAEWGKKIARAYPLLPYHHCCILTYRGEIIDLTVDGLAVYNLPIDHYLDKLDAVGEYSVTFPRFKVDELEVIDAVTRQFSNKRVDPTHLVGKADFAVRVRKDGISWLQLINKPGITLCTDIVRYAYDLREPVNQFEQRDETDPVSF